MIRKKELLDAFDDSWRFRWESLDNKLEGLSAEEAMYQHPMYIDEPVEVEHPAAGTILWHVIHLANVYYWYHSVMRERPNTPKEINLPMARSLEEAVSNLRRERQEFRNYVETLTEEQLDEKHFDGRTPLLITRMMSRHDAWHTSQIAVIRRLYRTRERYDK